ncbi:uncharacterized protein LOC143866437 [Tasmannia lanceolata]|uniref:uncharacterized protein LOC143866437 n=1 Tax=Tasmannia lanceolata TaxID=3420 RepID=UPI0040638C21
MADISGSARGVEKLNDNNYNNWSVRVQFYLLGQDLWDIVGGENTTPPTNADELKKWKIKAGKAMYILAVTIQDELLQHVKSAKTPKEAWDTLATLFARTNDAKLQRLEKELISSSQKDMIVSEYFTKIKSICEEISKLDPKNAISETQIRRTIIHGLRSEYNGIVTATRGWANEPTVTELESILANQEALDKQIYIVSIRDDDKSMFSKRKGFKDKNAVRSRTGGDRKYQEGWKNRPEEKGSQQGGAQQGRDTEDKIHCRQNNKCYSCKKRGHFARDCWSKRVEGNAATFTQNENDNENEWDFQASLAVEDPTELAASCIIEPEEESALVTVSDKLINYDDDWIVDSECSNHMTGDMEKLTDMMEYKKG